MDEMEKENRANDICVCGHPRKVHIGFQGLAYGDGGCGWRDEGGEGGTMPMPLFPTSEVRTI